MEFELALLHGGDIDRIAKDYNFDWVLDGRKNDISRY
jgi:hypothetical protein